MLVRIDYQTDGLTIEPGPAFRPEEADRACELLAALAPGAHVAIDLRNVRDCSDVALSRIVLALRDAQAEVTVRGASLHQERLLRYVGGDGQQPATAR
jgi:hypothetical protein